MFPLKRWTPLFLWNLGKRQTIPHSLAHNFHQQKKHELQNVMVHQLKPWNFKWFKSSQSTFVTFLRNWSKVHIDLCGPAYGTFCRSTGGFTLPKGKEVTLETWRKRPVDSLELLGSEVSTPQASISLFFLTRKNKSKFKHFRDIRYLILYVFKLVEITCYLGFVFSFLLWVETQWS